ncbi:MAG: LytTR family transcriptional regulator DNA-binding domain-containing protein [Bacteroidota bacterium]
MAEKVTILIVEDETLLAQDIAVRLNSFGYEVADMVDSVDKATASIAKQLPDLVMIDIMLKGNKNGIELGKIISENYKIPFIFLTSHADKHLVDQAKSVNPYAYMLKPFNDREINIAIELALSNFSNASPEQEISQKQNFEASDNSVLQVNDGLFLKKKNHFQKVALKDILWLEAESNYTVLHTQKESYTYSTVLGKIEEKLPDSLFIRVHRSFIVNIFAVTGFMGNLLYIDDKQIPVSKSYQQLVFNCFRTI